jgi:hypothetical protein
MVSLIPLKLEKFGVISIIRIYTVILMTPILKPSWIRAFASEGEGRDMIDLSNIDLLALVDTTVKRSASTDGGNYEGRCPICGDRDDFYVLPEHIDDDGKRRGLCACRECHPQRMDAIGYLRWARNMTYREAVLYLHKMFSLDLPGDFDKSRPPAAKKDAPILRVRPLPMNAKAPSAIWQERAWQGLKKARFLLQHEEYGKEARAYLRSRGLTDETIRTAGLGLIAVDTWDMPEKWGLRPEDVDENGVFLPRGIVFPYEYKGEIWKLRIRRFGDNIPKKYRYMLVSGSANGLYRADHLRVNGVALLFEGEIDALSAAQEIGDLAACVATGSTAHARIDLWKTRLALASQVLLCFDSDSSGQDAATYWGKRLGQIAKRLPVSAGYKDANEMLTAGLDLRAWVSTKLVMSDHISVIPNGTDGTESILQPCSDFTFDSPYDVDGSIDLACSAPQMPPVLVGDEIPPEFLQSPCARCGQTGQVCRRSDGLVLCACYWTWYGPAHDQRPATAAEQQHSWLNYQQKKSA